MTTPTTTHENEPLLSEQDSESGNPRSYQTDPLGNFRHVHFQPILAKIDSSSSIKDSTTSIRDTTNNNNISTTTQEPDDAFQFGARVAILVLVASLFATNQIPLGKDVYGHDIAWPQGLWVTISTLMVCWFPKLDAASVIQKSFQRLTGTLLGGCMALVVGILSRRILPKYVYRRAIFLHVFYALGCFLVTYWSMKIRLSRTSTIMSQYNYGTVLCLLTFTIALFPFLEQKDPWKKAIYRIINVAVGCVIAAVGSVLVLPRSTTDMLLQRIQKQCQWAGESAEAVLHAAADVLESHDPQFLHDGCGHSLRRTSSGQSHSFGNSLWGSLRLSALHKSFYRVHQEILQDEPSMTTLDVVLEKYESGIRDWKDTKGLFQMFRFDPFHYIVPASQEFRDGCDTILSRALRIQTTVVLLDGMVRYDPQHFLDETLYALLTEMGTLIRKMLAVPRQPANGRGNNKTAVSLDGTLDTKDAKTVMANDLAKERLMDRLYCFRDLVNQMARNMIQTESSLMDSIACGCSSIGKSKERKGGCGDSHCRNRSTVLDAGSKHYALLFLQLVEHLTHRSIALYDSWVEMEELSKDQLVST